MEPLTETKALVLMLADGLAGMTQAELPNFDRQRILAECRRIDAKVAADNAELDRLRARVGELEAGLRQADEAISVVKDGVPARWRRPLSLVQIPIAKALAKP